MTTLLDCPGPNDLRGVVAPAADATSERSVAPLNVLHVINGEHYSGAERVQDLLAARLPELGYQVGFACLKPDKFPRARHCQDVPLHAVPMRSRMDLRVVRRLCRLIREGDYRLIHAHTPRSLLVSRLVALWTRRSLVYHVHSPTCRDSTDCWRNRFNGFCEKASLRGKSHLIAVSSSLGGHMQQQRGLSPERITVVPNGVPAPERGRSDRYPGPVWTLGVVALFRPRKGLEILLDALSVLRRQEFPVRLRAVGPFETDEFASQIKHRARELAIEDAIEWTGFQNDVAQHLTEMDLLVLPSLFGEGLPMVILEAMAAGVPVVATRIEGVPEAVDHGVQGLLATPGDANDLAGCIRCVVSGGLDWRSLRANALRQHAAFFSDQAMAARVAAVYRDELARRQR